jgi:hypothetical protein
MKQIIRKVVVRNGGCTKIRRTPGDRKVFRAVPFVMAGQVGVAHGFELLRGDGHIAADDRLRVPVVTDFLNYFNNRFVSLSETRSCI